MAPPVAATPLAYYAPLPAPSLFPSHQHITYGVAQLQLNSMAPPVAIPTPKRPLPPSETALAMMKRVRITEQNSNGLLQTAPVQPTPVAANVQLPVHSPLSAQIFDTFGRAAQRFVVDLDASIQQVYRQQVELLMTQLGQYEARVRELERAIEAEKGITKELRGQLARINAVAQAATPKRSSSR